MSIIDEHETLEEYYKRKTGRMLTISPEDAKVLREAKELLDRIKARVYENKKARAELRKKVEEEERRLDAELKEIRSQCPHWSNEYFPDASGNNDSSYVCKLCGLDRR